MLTIGGSLYREFFLFSDSRKIFGEIFNKYETFFDSVSSLYKVGLNHAVVFMLLTLPVYSNIVLDVVNIFIYAAGRYGKGMSWKT
mgnify:FL=1